MSANNPDVDDQQLKDNMHQDFEDFDKEYDNFTPKRKDTDSYNKSYSSPTPFKKRLEHAEQ